MDQTPVTTRTLAARYGRRGPRPKRAIAGDREIAMAWLRSEALPRIVGRFNPSRIILFGSFAWGEPNAASDIDLCVVLGGQREEMDFFRTSAAIEASIPRGPHRLEVIAYTPKQIERARRIPFFARILSEGKVLYAMGSRDPLEAAVPSHHH